MTGGFDAVIIVSKINNAFTARSRDLNECNVEHHELHITEQFAHAISDRVRHSLSGSELCRLLVDGHPR